MLIADDDEAIAFAIRDYFSARGFDVTSAATSTGACAQLAAQHFDVIIVDLCFHGEGLTEGLRVVETASERYHVRNIILLSGSLHEVLPCSDRYAPVRLHKPIELARLAAIVDGMLAVA